MRNTSLEGANEIWGCARIEFKHYRFYIIQ